MKGWVRLHTADNPVEVGFVRGLLEAEGIETRVRSMELWAAAVEIYFAEGARPSVWVREADLAWAQRVLDQAQSHGQGEAWRCEGCGERIEAQFTACWRCVEDADRD